MFEVLFTKGGFSGPRLFVFLVGSITLYTDANMSNNRPLGTLHRYFVLRKKEVNQNEGVTFRISKGQKIAWARSIKVSEKHQSLALILLTANTNTVMEYTNMFHYLCYLFCAGTGENFSTIYPKSIWCQGTLAKE